MSKRVSLGIKAISILALCGLALSLAEAATAENINPCLKARMELQSPYNDTFTLTPRSVSSGKWNCEPSRSKETCIFTPNSGELNTSPTVMTFIVGGRFINTSIQFTMQNKNGECILSGGRSFNEKVASIKSLRSGKNGSAVVSATAFDNTGAKQ